MPCLCSEQVSAAFCAMLPQQRTLAKHFQQRRHGRIGSLRERCLFDPRFVLSTKFVRDGALRDGLPIGGLIIRLIYPAPDAGLSPHPRRSPQEPLFARTDNAFITHCFYDYLSPSASLRHLASALLYPPANGGQPGRKEVSINKPAPQCKGQSIHPSATDGPGYPGPTTQGADGSCRKPP